MNILAITQARIGSTRFPEKILKTIEGVSLLEMHLRRIQKSKLLTKIKVATTIEPDADKIVSIASKLGIDVYKGSIDNVLERFYNAAKVEQPDYIVRLTSDCPLIDPIEIDKVIEYAISHKLDYVSNTLKPTFPDGIDVEIFTFSALEKAYKEATIKSEIEHVSPYIWKNSSFMGGTIFQSDCVMNAEDFSDYRLTVDTQEDFQIIERLVGLLGFDKPWSEYVKVIQEHSDIQKLNDMYTRNEGYQKSLDNDNK
jgi:spore coat polysaccharide biosynthesis protein SpsF